MAMEVTTHWNEIFNVLRKKVNANFATKAKYMLSQQRETAQYMQKDNK